MHIRGMHGGAEQVGALWGLFEGRDEYSGGPAGVGTNSTGTHGDEGQFMSK